MKIIISIFVLLCDNIYSQHLHGQFMNADVFGKKAYLYDMFQNNGNPIDEVIIDLKGNFSFNKTDYILGFYRIQLKGEPPVVVVLNPMEKDVEIQVNKENDKKHITVLNSLENTALHRHYSLMNAYNRLEYLQFQLSFPSDEVLQNTEEYVNDIKKYIYFIKVSLEDLESNYSQTFTYDVLAKLIPIVNSPYNERIERFFDSKIILDSKYLRSPLIFSKVNTYLNYYSGENAIDMHIAIDEILLAAHENYEVYRYCLNEILLFLDRQGQIEFIEYVTSEYIDDEFDIITKPSLRKKIEGMSKLTVGTVAPDLFIPDVNGNKVGLHDLYKNNKLNLLFFWSSRCPHCMKTLPKIQEIYENYRSAGIEVIAISIDKKKEEWNKAITQENLKWTNVSSLKGWGSKSTDVYYVSSTPTFYLIDNNAKIVGRPDGIEEVINQVDNLLR